jgi:molecular chaperone GrpE
MSTEAKSNENGAETEAAAPAVNEPAPAANGTASPGAPAPAEALDVEALQQNAAKAAEYFDRFLRLAADFDNFKKRAARERQEAIKFANTSLLEKLIPVLDNFEMAMSACANAPTGGEQSLQAGVTMILQQMQAVLKDAGLEEVDAQGKVFDPNFHEAVAQEASADVPEGQVLKQLRKGYRLKERLLRPATVVVAKKP